MKVQGIVSQVIEPTDWTHKLVVVIKPNGKLRICVDLTKLNRYVKRPFHPLVSPRHAIANISTSGRYFTTYDAKHGYWQIPLDETSLILTTSITPWGRYKFLRGSMGLISTGDEYCRRTDAILGRIPRLHRVVDNMLAEADNIATMNLYQVSMSTQYYGNNNEAVRLTRPLVYTDPVWNQERQ